MSLGACVRRGATVVLAVSFVTLANTACVSRNVESISAEEAAQIGPPPEPLSDEQRAASVVQIPGIEGTFAVASELPDGAREGVVFVIVRVAGRAGGPPLAILQLPADFPADFRISEENSMIPGTPLVGDLDVIVRFDQDGNAFSRAPGDLEGRGGPVQVGGRVDIVLHPAEIPPAGDSGGR